MHGHMAIYTGKEKFAPLGIKWEPLDPETARACCPRISMCGLDQCLWGTSLAPVVHSVPLTVVVAFF